MKRLSVVDPEIAQWLEKELVREISTIELIASENFVYQSVLEAQGSVLTNKYAEGYPGKRYHGGCEYIDHIESIGIERAKKLFGAEHANIQPHSGVNANLAAFMALIEPGDTIMGMNLQHGGHLSHGSRVSIVGKFYNAVDYGVDKDTELIDYDMVAELAKQHRPKLIIAGASAYSREIDFARFKDIADSVGAYFMVDMAHIAGLVAAKVIPSPIPHADFVTSSTTKTFCSARSGMVFSKKEHAKLLDKGTFPGSLGSIHLHTMAAKAWSFKYAGREEFKRIMEQVVKNAKALAKELENHGFRIVSGGTDNHLLVVDLRSKGITGKVFQEALDSIGITVNKNMIPFDPENPSVTSGVRIGLTAITQRGLREVEIVKIADIMNRIADNPEDDSVLNECKADAQKLISGFPLYPEGTFRE